MTPNSVVAWPAHSPYLCFVDKEEETVHLKDCSLEWLDKGRYIRRASGIS